MRLEYIPLLQLQRDLYRLPRSQERFYAYLRTIIDDTGDDLDLPPLVVINPMAREHVPALLDQYVELNADDAATQTVAEAERALADVDGEYKIALVIADDLKGGGTNRYATEFGMRCGSSMRTGNKASRRVAWLAATLWSSEPASLGAVREGILMTVYGIAYRRRHGAPRTLREMLALEGFCMARTGCTEPTLDAEDLAYTREVIEPHLDAADMRTAIECLYGDAAARSLDFTPHGLSHRAGLALALNDAHGGPCVGQ